MTVSIYNETITGSLHQHGRKTLAPFYVCQLRRVSKERCSRLQMRARHVLVERHAMPGSLAEQDVAVSNRWLAVDKVCPPGDVVGMELDDQEVGDRRADVRRRHGADRAGNIVRRNVDVVGV